MIFIGGAAEGEMPNGENEISTDQWLQITSNLFDGRASGGAGNPENAQKCKQ